MKKYTFLGLAVLALIPTVAQTVELTGKTIYISVLPAFAGLLLIFFGTEKLSYNNRFMKSVCGTSSALAVPAFIFAVAQLYPFYLPYVFTDASGGKRFFAAVIKICADIYDGGQYIFFGLSSIYLAVVIAAFTSEMKHRAVTAKVSGKFSHKDAYGDRHYSKKPTSCIPWYAPYSPPFLCLWAFFISSINFSAAQCACNGLRLI